MKNLFAITALITLIPAIIMEDTSMQIAALTVCVFNWISYWGIELKQQMNDGKW